VVVDLEPPHEPSESISFIHADLSEAEAGDEAVEHVISAHDRLDILVNNVGIYPNFELADTNAEVFDRFAAVNLRSHFLLTRAFARHVATREPGGKIVNVASIDALRPSLATGHAAYGATKAGILGLTYQTARELAPLEIRVNAICPGVILTEGVEQTTGRSTEELKEVLNGLLPRIPAGRFGKPDDIAKAAVFLASAASDFITGQHLVVDGGFLLT
jgi:2-dehydro-3-deoxy-D-gluconate 5-dehydrogenase